MLKLKVGAPLLAAAMTIGSATGAAAATITVEATGEVANISYGSFVFNGRSFQTGYLQLQPSSPLPLELNDGDIIEFSISLDGVFGVPGAGEQFFGLNFYGDEDQEDAGASNLGTMTLQGATGLATNPAPVACGNCLSAIYFDGNAGPFSFTGLSGSTTITLAVPYSVNEISLSYQVSNPVPEPGGWALMIVGLGLAGAGLRQHRPHPIVGLGHI